MYAKLRAVLDRALEQAESGKGKERHARGETPFDRQPICEIGRMVGIGYNLGQAMKKAQEASRLAGEDRKVSELLGAINYLASAVMLIEESAPALVPLEVELAAHLGELAAALGPEVSDEDRHPKVVFRRYEDIAKKTKPPTLLDIMQKEERGARERLVADKEKQMSFNFSNTCPTCNEKGGFHHSQCAMNPIRSKS